MNAIAIQTQVVKLYEVFQMTPEEIALDQNLSEDFVRATLMTKSQVFKDVNRAKEDKRDFITHDELHEFYENYKALARYTESDIVKEKCLAKLIDDGRGRLDKKIEAETRPTNVINIIQVMLERAKLNKEIAVNEIRPIQETCETSNIS